MSGSVRSRTLWLLAMLGGAPAAAHWLGIDEVVHALESADGATRAGVVHAAPDPAVPRLLVIRVDARWRALPAEQRRRTAEEWLALWRHADEHGIVAVVDDATDAPLVNFDGADRARVVEPPAPPAAGGPRR